MEQPKVLISKIVLTQPRETEQYRGYIKQALEAIAPGLKSLPLGGALRYEIDRFTLVIVNSYVPKRQMEHYLRVGAQVMQFVFCSTDPNDIYASHDGLRVELVDQVGGESTLTLGVFKVMPSFSPLAVPIVLGWVVKT